jgi:cell division protein FtsQ
MNWNTIRLLFLFLCLAALYGFSEVRNQRRAIPGLRVVFEGDENQYLTEDAVNKLLIQKIGPLQNVEKERIVLNTVESAVQAHDMVKNAQIFMSLDGQINANIVQRHPIGRISGEYPYYLDDEGKKMPLSSNYSARVPLITGEINESTLKGAFAILQKVGKDDFFAKNLIGIYIAGINSYQLILRRENLTVQLGDTLNLDVKFKNFKAFYSNALHANRLSQYKSVSLAFNNQVVCTKI